jgi:hypothetical protein
MALRFDNPGSRVGHQEDCRDYRQHPKPMLGPVIARIAAFRRPLDPEQSRIETLKKLIVR